MNLKIRKTFDEKSGLHTWSPQDLSWGAVVSAPTIKEVKNKFEIGMQICHIFILSNKK